MMHRKTLTRRRMLKLAGATIIAGLVNGATAQSTSGRPHLRIGTVFPARSGESTVLASVNDFTGEAARMAAILADDRVGDQASRAGLTLEVLLASSPSSDAAHRAASRLVATEEVHALVGGIGAGQASAIADVAAGAGIPFLNVGSSSDTLRTTYCGTSVFHLEASGAMYVDAMVAHHAADGPRAWYVVHESTADGVALGARALEAVARHDPTGTVEGSVAVVPEQPVYIGELLDIERSDADTILVLLEARDQIAFLGQQEDVGVDALSVCFPDSISQTRDYMAASRRVAPRHSPSTRFAAWDVTLRDHGADVLNDRFTSRWGEVLNPTGWATYSAIEMLTSVALAADDVDPSAIAAALADPTATFDMMKGVPMSFRSWDHQLRQPMYVVAVDPDAIWQRLSLQSRVDIASVAAELPSLDALRASGADRATTDALLDTFGDGPNPSCNAT